MDRCNLNLIQRVSIIYLFYCTKSSICLMANQDILYNCLSNSMCRCFPNETKLLEINCNEVTLYKFPEFLHGTVKHIEISNTEISNVDDENFQGLRLESLKLANNKLQEFSEKSFSFMTHSLISLDISGNSFQSVPLESIKSIQTLSRLIAQRNFIQHLDGNWANLADSLRSLHLSENSISEITFNHDENKHNYSTSALSSLPALIEMNHSVEPSTKQQQYKTFSKLRKLVWLDLSSNRIGSQHLGINTLPRTLVTLFLERNLLSVFPTDTLDHLHDLRILSLKDNLLTKLNDVTFQTFKTHLEKIDLSMNSFDELPQNLFNHTTRIKAINFDKNFITRLESDTFNGMNIVHLTISCNRINYVDMNAFATLEDSLEYLDFERNFLPRIPEAIHNLNKLRYLYFSSNEISSVEALPKTLKVVSLSSNNFSRIPNEVLSNCTGLFYLNMGYNQITSIPENTFEGWGHFLETLLLRNNKISELSYGAFNGLDSIKEISLSFNDIHYIHPLVFENISKSLKILELSFSIYSEDYPQEAISYLTLKIIPDNSLATLTELTYINLSFNRLTLIPIGLFVADVHRNLLEIDLSYNAIDVVLSQTFSGLELLQLINLSSNKIKFMEKSSFQNLPFLTHIDLRYNQMRNISEDSFESLPNLRSIDFQFNNFHSFSLKSFKHVSNATTPMSINISNNAINQFDGELKTYLYIYSLDLSNNQLSSTEAFKNIGYSLRMLYLNGNNMSVLGNHAFGDLPFLEILHLASNNISSVRRRSFQGLPNLQELDLSHNKIDSLAVELFSNLKMLRSLKINYNQLKGLPRDVFLNTRIEHLDLSNNLVSIWPVNSLSDVGFTLRSVRLDFNLLEYLDATAFVNTPYLSHLCLSYNQLKILPDNTFAALSNLTSLDLSFNPLITTNFRELFLNIGPRLKILNLRSVGLYSVSTLFRGLLKGLTELDISRNQIQEVDSLLDMKCLRKLKISDNRISNMSLSLPHVSLRSLDISRNPLRKISVHDFTSLWRLEELAIEDVKIPNSDSFSKLHNLKVLRISSQHNFSELISKLRGLRELYITVYDHRLDGKYFGKLVSNTKLNLIDISGHKLRSIASNAFHGLVLNVNLKILIRNSLISDLPPSLFYALKHIPKLAIDLIDNKLSRFTFDTFYPNASAWDSLGSRSLMGGINTEGNFLPCDCDHVWYGQWLRRWLRETAQVNVVTKEESKHMLNRARQSTCIDPTNGKRIPFLEIFPEDLLCHASALSSRAPNLFNVSFEYVISNMILTMLLLIFKSH